MTMILPLSNVTDTFVNVSALSYTYGSLIYNMLLDKEARDVTLVVNCVVVCGIISIFGIATNVINLFVFSKQGYGNTMNISLSGIALSDICTLISMIWFGICVSPFWEGSDTSVAFSEVVYLTAGWPNCIFSRITCIITVFITIERCLCVVIPLKVKRVITKTKTFIVIFFIFISQMMTTIPTYYSTYIDWKFFPDKNRSLLGILRINNWEQLESISIVLQAMMQAASFMLLIFFTSLLVMHLRRKSSWRASSTSHAQKTSLSIRDRKSERMIVLIAVILIACFSPVMVFCCVIAIEPGIAVGGVYENMFFVVGSFPLIFQTVNSSVNILIYYNMSSNYKRTLDQSIPICRRIISVTVKLEADNY